MDRISAVWGRGTGVAAGDAEWDGVGMFGDPAAYQRVMGRWCARVAPAFPEEVGLAEDGPFVLSLRAWFARATVPGSERSGGT
ncbi:MAG TPA: hypothetical protein VE503_08370 [Ornithinibacter sp.]|nr:hypothetical protein [Ornithinibacter sp.]